MLNITWAITRMLTTLSYAPICGSSLILTSVGPFTRPLPGPFIDPGPPFAALLLLPTPPAPLVPLEPLAAVLLVVVRGTAKVATEPVLPAPPNPTTTLREPPPHDMARMEVGAAGRGVR